MEEEIIKSANDTMMQLHNEVMQLNKRIDRATKYIEENCIDDEFYVNLTNKEKSIIEALKILKGE